ncbi:hypothetical protein N7519_009765 [Penicillium mononematosum]|uniref:uncharacterized protein n=1 Tax=Penicillium mononematosum TaxID=268346 RepID=UPI002546BAC1|nr:uncharacterized protein N7519_009765 [Penicillium mononematosum]KAJ6179304.1 hypothetical protein N7519_009765 [Penicillium mononematosum]
MTQSQNPKALGKPKGLLQWLSSSVHTVLAPSALRGEMPRYRAPVLISELRHLKGKTSPGFNKHLKRVERRTMGRDDLDVQSML